ncbi:rod shape-determining protein MreC [Seonamhaeicola sediminis]|uniref:Cell shape-determining protein MreC n=1 Tax=Seonamhaeicola sediminis TaxID=2528206 RepID=A0A562YGK5_9FLAO|nr:rod shape-determining protein MreC [Seonamhaeicola sediminis]TWO33483.1 rod shape-determining protein MreC [Seonamhaeicola sediminis]
MQQIINFIIRNKNFLLFLLLFFIAIVFTIQSHSYHKSKFINSANFISGGVYNSVNNISEYFTLKSQNQLLSEENNRLRELLFNSNINTNSNYLDSVLLEKSYTFFAAKVIKNSYSATDNILLINKGKSDSIKQDFGVITTQGIVGIVDKSSSRFSTVISILNTTNSSISAGLKRTAHYGSLRWNGKNPELVQLIDIPINAKVNIGDTIVTSGQSSIFPKGIPIGVIQDFKNDVTENFYDINVKLFNDMTNLEHVYIIENKNKEEIDNLLNE